VNTIECKALTKRYGKARGIEDLSFGIEKGEIFGYLGPNGSGKTTTIRCLMGLLAPTSGQCRILGAPVVPGKATYHARIGYLPGDFRIWPQYTAGQSLRLMAALGDGDNAKKRRNQLADRLDLNLDRRLGTLSKGNRQKVGVIYALQHRPDLLILDEPTIGLDPLISQVVLDLIREASESGATVMLSSHDLAEVAAVCRHAAILREGRLVELAPVSQIVRQGERRLKVWFVKGAQVPALPADRLAGVRVISQDSDTLHVAYQGTAQAVLKWIASFPVDRIATPQTSLQEAFMQYYEKEADR